MQETVISKGEKKPRKPVVEGTLVLDSNVLARKKVLTTPRTAWVLTYRSGERVLGEFTLLVFESYFHILYAIPVPGTTPLKANFKIEVERTRCHFGHRGRPWFLCPGGTKAKPCRRRCQTLYLPLDERCFACLDCHGLAYTSTQRKGNVLWERYLRPKRDLETAMADLKRFRSPVKRKEAFRRFQAASKALQEFQAWTDETMARWASGSGRLRKKDFETMRGVAASDFQRPPITLSIERAEDWYERVVGQGSAGRAEAGSTHADRPGEGQQQNDVTSTAPLPCST